ncbi:uncharacterized protein RCH25_008151 [Pelodytes ibericus]
MAVVGLQVVEQVSRNCVLNKYCSLEGSMSYLGNVQSQMGFSCCSTDNCTPSQPQFRAIDTNPNGLVCRSCLATDSDWCYTDDTIACTGRENMCLLQTTKIRGPVTATTAFRGCATKSICDIRSELVSYGSMSIESKFKCTRLKPKDYSVASSKDLANSYLPFRGKNPSNKQTLLLKPCLILADLSTSYALDCTTCFSMTGSSCSGTSIACPSDYVCGIAKTVTSAMGLQVSEQVSRSCVPRNVCSLKASMSLYGNMRSQVGYSCCYTDNCTPPQPPLPELDTKPNGLVCRTCVSADSDWCYTDETMKCTGSENMCLLQTMKTKGPVTATTAIRGCATKSFCDAGSQSLENAGLSVESKITCTSGAGGLYSGFLLSLLVSCFLTKLMS